MNTKYYIKHKNGEIVYKKDKDVPFDNVFKFCKTIPFAIDKILKISHNKKKIILKEYIPIKPSKLCPNRRFKFVVKKELYK